MNTEILASLFNACNPLKPATEAYFVDCSEARGSTALARQVQSQLALARETQCRFLFSGHIGCGKSSELAQLRYVLEHPVPPHHHYFTVLLDVNDYLDIYDVAASDLLLAIMTEVSATLRQAGAELKQDYLGKRLEELKAFLLSDVEITEGELEVDPGKAVPGFPLKGKVKIQRLKQDPDNRKKVRQALQPQMSTLLDEINLVLAEARHTVQSLPAADGQTYEDIVLILDNLEKIRKLDGHEEGLASQRELFLERYAQLTGLDTHVIYTVPLRLVRSADAGQLKSVYGTSPFVLPMIKVIDRHTRVAYQPGVDALKLLIQKRLGATPLTQVFTDQALHELIGYSGGHVRTLMEFITSACAYALQNGVTLIDVREARQAIRQSVTLYEPSIPYGHWTKLARLELSPDQKIPGGDDDYLRMLGNLSILEYINGDSNRDWITSATPWYAVNPIVRELLQFKEAVAQLKQTPTP